MTGVTGGTGLLPRNSVYLFGTDKIRDNFTFIALSDLQIKMKIGRSNIDVIERSCNTNTVFCWGYAEDMLQ